MLVCARALNTEVIQRLGGTQKASRLLPRSAERTLITVEGECSGRSDQVTNLRGEPEQAKQGVFN